MASIQCWACFRWATAAQALANGNSTVPDYALFQFSAACWYFGQELTNQLAFAAGVSTHAAVTPIGLISTAIGGSMIEEWMPNSTRQQCKQTAAGTFDGMLYNEKVVPYLDMTVKGFLWYQGENDMHNIKGNSLDHSGYGCEIATMVQYWRQQWSATPGTTDALTPFGTVVLPGSGSGASAIRCIVHSSIVPGWSRSRALCLWRDCTHSRAC